MSLPWFRLYREMKDDPKIGFLDDSAFRVFIEAMCWACEKDAGGKTGLTTKNANWALRRDVTSALHALQEAGLVRVLDSGEITIPKWNERQMRSDSSAERVRKHRETKAIQENEKPLQTQNVTVTDTVTTPLQKQACNALEESRIEENRGEEKRQENPLPPSGEGEEKAASGPAEEPEQGEAPAPEDSPATAAQKGQLQLRAERIMGRRPETPLTVSEARAFKKNKPCIQATTEADWLLLEAFYALPQSETYARKDLATLVNNWNGEIDRAKAHKPGNNRAEKLRELERATRELSAFGKASDHDAGSKAMIRIKELRPHIEALRKELGVIA